MDVWCVVCVYKCIWMDGSVGVVTLTLFSLKLFVFKKNEMLQFHLIIIIIIIPYNMI